MRPVTLTLTLLLGHLVFAASEGEKPGYYPFHETARKNILPLPLDDMDDISFSINRGFYSVYRTEWIDIYVIPRHCNNEQKYHSANSWCNNMCRISIKVDPNVYGDKSGQCPIFKRDPTCSSEKPLPKCTNDRQCDGAKKCCMTNCYERKCVDPVNPEPLMDAYALFARLREVHVPQSKCPGEEPAGSKMAEESGTTKPGHCPVHEKELTDKYQYPPHCNNDEQCDGAQKCCRNPMNVLTCTDPVPFGDKSGQCPEIELDQTCREPPPAKCSIDEECDGAKKCCVSKCFEIKCVDPVYPVVKPGKCAFSLDFGKRYFFNFMTDCKYDNDCEGAKKCCIVPYQNIQCMDPVLPDAGK